MDKNKSIDGLVSHSEKVARASRPLKSIPSQKRPTSIKIQTAKKPKIQSTPSTPLSSSPEPIYKPTTSSEPKKSSNPGSVEDFLKPVQAFNFDNQTGELTAAKEPIKKPLAKDITMKDSNHPNLKNSKQSKAQKPKMSKKKKIILSVIAIILTIVIIAGVSLVLWGNDIIAKITGGQGNILDLLTFVDEHYELLKTDNNGRTNILAIGTSGYNMDGEEGNGVHDGAQLTDSIMVISLDQETGDVAMLSLPRDLKASPTCTATGKINEVYWCNNMYGEDEAAGATALMVEVGDILGLDFQYYAHLNWGSLVQIVDTLGGITINLDEPISDYTYTGAVFEAGVDYEINGEEALGLARARHGTYSGDFSRGASQQKILIGIKDKVTEKKLSISELMSLAGTLGDNLRTNFSLEEIKTLAHLASVFDLNTMRQISLIDPEPLMTTGIINEISYVLPSAGVGNYFAIQRYLEKMLSSDPKVYEDASILILNGTGEPGLAASEQSALESEGYANIDTDDAPETESGYPEKYELYIMNSDKPGTAKLLTEKYGESSIVSPDSLPDDIDNDYDFILILGENNNIKEG